MFARRLLLLPSTIALVVVAGCEPTEIERVEAIKSLERSQELDIERLEAAAQAESMRVRVAAIGVLGRSRDERAKPIVLQAVKDADPGVRATVAVALTELGKPGEAEVVDALITLTKDTAPIVKRRALQGLQVVGDERAAEALIASLDEPDEDLRREAAKALTSIASPTSIDALIAALEDDDVIVRGWVARALGEIGDPRARPALEALGQRDDPHDQAASQSSLERLDSRIEDSDDKG